MLDLINGFHGHHRFLSNFHEQPVTWDGITYPSGEAGYNAGKTLDPQQRAWIAAAPSPGEAKRRGRQVQLRDDWDDLHRYAVMQDVIEAKFTDPALRTRLLETGNALLVERNTWHDQTWGCCSCPRHQAVPGRNLLGRYLMDHRARLASAPVGAWTRVSLTGHRPQGLPPGSEPWLENELRRIAAKLATEHGTRVAISGAAAGADLIWAEAARDADVPVWLYQPYTGHDERWNQDWRDRLTAARREASRVDTLGTRFSVDVLHERSSWMIRDCDAIIAVVDPRRTSGGTWQALKKIPPSMPIIRLDVLHRKTSLRAADPRS
ncbi:hypothetical protein DL991_41195 [Amycolatopsis sp. WAC 01375]|uniref:NADAR family protein n=1 Tax=Amycolatopsis sp. WAC 01375 TaxID=2203194 RepID=UPI000F796BF9|nr:NADAR family protein [Amycolatopsis sp. WAC 01375]RSM68688.1 hypothetical protein DL991_41195 [Amycolatopsis sp. WAC 01375]